VRGYFKHQLVPDPLARPGRQDLTADVDFAAVDLHGREEGFETVLFTTLGRFLRGGGAEDELQALRSRSEAPAWATASALAAQAASATASATASALAPQAAPAELASSDPLEADRQATVLENLLDERDLGSVFKVLVQVRG
jgi:SAM-dependent MidA family methyltransferase